MRANEHHNWDLFDETQTYPIKYKNGGTYYGLAPHGNWMKYFADTTQYTEILKMAGEFQTLMTLSEWFMEHAMVESGKKRWAEKSPGNIFFVKERLDYFPNGKVILTYREPQDTIASLMYNRGFDISAALSRYTLSNLALDKITRPYGPSKAITVVYYHHLIDNPKRHLKLLWDFLEVDGHKDIGVDMVEDRGSTWDRYKDVASPLIRQQMELLDYL